MTSLEMIICSICVLLTILAFLYTDRMKYKNKGGRMKSIRIVNKTGLGRDTELFTESGEKIHGAYRVELVCDVDNVNKAIVYFNGVKLDTRIKDITEFGCDYRKFRNLEE